MDYITKKTTGDTKFYTLYDISTSKNIGNSSKLSIAKATALRYSEKNKRRVYIYEEKGIYTTSPKKK